MSHSGLRNSGMALAVLVGSAVCFGCGPEPEDLAATTPSPRIPAPTGWPTAVPTKTIVVQFIGWTGEPLTEMRVFSSLGDLLLDQAETDDSGHAVLIAARHGLVTGIHESFGSTRAITAEVADGTFMRVRSFFGTLPPPGSVSVEIVGAPPGTFVMSYGGYYSYGSSGSMPGDGTPLVESLDTWAIDHQYDGGLTISAWAGTWDGVNTNGLWGAATDVLPGGFATISLTTNQASTPVEITWTGSDCEWKQVSARSMRKGAGIVPAAGATLTTSLSASLFAFGEPIADAMFLRGTCFTYPHVREVLRLEPWPLSSGVLDMSDVTPELASAQLSWSSAGHPILSWESGEGSADAVSALAYWTDGQGQRYSWELVVEHEGAGAHSLSFPLLPREYQGAFGVGTPAGYVVYEDVSVVDGYEDSSEIRSWPPVPGVTTHRTFRTFGNPTFWPPH